MPADLHVHFRLPAGASYTRKLKALADQTNTSPSLAARTLIVEWLEGELRKEMVEQFAALEEDLAAIAATQREQAEELRRFRADFNAALKKTAERRVGHGGDGRQP